MICFLSLGGSDGDDLRQVPAVCTRALQRLLDQIDHRSAHEAHHPSEQQGDGRLTKDLVVPLTLRELTAVSHAVEPLLAEPRVTLGSSAQRSAHY